MVQWSRQYGFLDLPAEVEEARIALFGVPYDGTTWGRPGSRAAPAEVRQASLLLEPYSPLITQHIHDVGAIDLGDLALPQTIASHHQVMALVQEATRGLLQQGTVPVMIGGEHLCTLPLLAALLDRYPDVMVLQLDAHTNLRAHHKGESHCHHTVMHHVHEMLNDPQRVIVYGLRSGSREEFDVARQCRVCGPFPSFDHQRLTALRYHLEAVHYRPIYLICDLDVFDPSVMPGTSYPEPGGIFYEEFRHILTYLKGRNVVGVGIVECCPAADPTGISMTLAAKVVRELSLLPAVRSPEVSKA